MKIVLINMQRLIKATYQNNVSDGRVKQYQYWGTFVNAIYIIILMKSTTCLMKRFLTIDATARIFRVV